MITRSARTALRAKRAAVKNGSGPFWEGYWNDDETQPYAVGSKAAAEWQNGRDERLAETED